MSVWDRQRVVASRVLLLPSQRCLRQREDQGGEWMHLCRGGALWRDLSLAYGSWGREYKRLGPQTLLYNVCPSHLQTNAPDILDKIKVQFHNDLNKHFLELGIQFGGGRSAGMNQAKYESNIAAGLQLSINRLLRQGRHDCLGPLHHERGDGLEPPVPRIDPPHL